MERVGLSRDEFDELYDLYYTDLARYVFSFVNDAEAARDLVHDLFLNLWKSKFKPDSQRPVKAYLFTMARNQAFNYLKHQQVIATNERGIAEEYNLRQDEYGDIEKRYERVRKKLDELPDKQREVVMKCCVEGKLYRETACELGISENTVKTHLMRAMRFLRGELREDFILLVLMSGDDSFKLI